MEFLSPDIGLVVELRSLGKQWPIAGPEEEKALLEVLHSGKWCRVTHQDRPSKVDEFENAFARYQDAKFGIAVTNGTQALEIAFKAAGVKPGDEVIVPALTFVATATAAILVNAVPVIVDADPETYNISPDAIEAAITDKTRVICPVHNGGYAADMDRIMAIAREHNLMVVEDCAHAQGTQWKGKGVGSIGHFGCFSFQQGKTMTAGEGGIILTNDEDLAAEAYSYHNIGRIANRPFTEFHKVATNARMTEFQAAILLAQLSRMDEQVAIRERNTAYLAEGMREIPGLAPLERDPRMTRWCFYYWNFKYKQDEFAGLPRNTFIRALSAEGVRVGVGAHGGPIYRNPVLQGKGLARVCDCPEAQRIIDTEALSLAHSLFLGDRAEMDLILAAMRKIRENVGELL
jgi:dTDP-4-amino-4,6-dideoxygalactose transaminase